MQALAALALPGLCELTPGIRSLQVHYQPEALPWPSCWRRSVAAGRRWAMPRTCGYPRASSICRCPGTIRPAAGHREIHHHGTQGRPLVPEQPGVHPPVNDLESLEAVKRIVFDASYLVMGLGDVYLGAPVATPLDPRHRLVTTKYNPARTWTAENSVGIGGAYLCVYGMEGPGGYQFVGRTLQMWNRYREVEAFHGQPYLLRFFDQIRFYEVSAEELLRIRADFPLVGYLCASKRANCPWPTTRPFWPAKPRASPPFAAPAERLRRGAATLDRLRPGAFRQPGSRRRSDRRRPPRHHQLALESPVAGNLWQAQVQPGDQVEAGQPLLILESMKMEIPLLAPCSAGSTTCRSSPARRSAPASACWSSTRREGSHHDIRSAPRHPERRLCRRYPDTTSPHR